MVELPRISLPVSLEVEKMSYKAKVSIGQNEYSGIMVIKKMSTQEYRIAYFSEVGMSYLEGAMGPGNYPYSMNIKSISPFLTGKKTIEGLTMSLNMMLVPAAAIQESEVMKDTDEQLWLRAPLSNGRSYWGKIDKKGHIDRAYFSLKGKPEAGLQIILGYDVNVAGYPSHVKVVDKKGGVILELISL